MKIILDQGLLFEREGDLVRRTMEKVGFKESSRGEFEGVGRGAMQAQGIPCPAGSWVCCVTHSDLSIPTEALVSPDALLLENDGTSNCPPLSTLVAGDLLMKEAGDSVSLCERILREWDWWLCLRSTSREMTVTWSSTPETDLVLLFNQLDACQLGETFDRPLAAGRVVELIGHHPVTPLAALAAGVRSKGSPSEYESCLITRRALGSPRFWNQLISKAI